MNNPVFFSSLGMGIVVAGLGFSNYHKVEESLPFVGALSEINVLLDTENKVNEVVDFISVPEETNATAKITRYNELACAKDLFKNVSWDSLPESESDESISIEDSSKLNGCLAVWWNTEESAEDEESTKIGNVMWGMSDGNKGSIFFSKVSVKNKVVKRVSENLLFLEKGDNEDTWKVLLSKSEGAKAEEEEGFDASDDSDGGWLTVSDNSGEKNWIFRSEKSSNPCNSCQEPDEWSNEIIKWIDDPKEDGLMMKAYGKYEEFKGRFESQEER